MSDESIFAAALAISNPSRRSEYLDQACCGNLNLRREVDALLAAHAADSPLDRASDGGPSLAATCLPDSNFSGAIIAGRYKLLEEIGEGGMGAVFVAEQTEPVRRKVALKLIKAGMDSKAVLARFEAERQALAMMDHPNIAKVLDGGVTEAGRPFFVMEYVKGVPITEYCDSVKLNIRERLALFVQVCSAVQHAHQKGIIHRDLKPSNILVAPYDDQPVPKVIDFGLAKALHQRLTERTLHTAHETVIGTPLYMSPEQAQLNNLDVDTRSDIYSLGVLLYELLTGTTPLEKARFKEAAWDEIRRIIRDEEPPRPSTRLSSTGTLPSLAACRQTEPIKLTKQLRGELDWIVMKALEKDRTRRYETANGLARDIQRYLADEPVEACPPSAAYRLRKLARKYKAPLAIAGAFLALLLSGIAVSSWQAIRARNAEIAARSAEAAARDKEQEATVARQETAAERDTAVSARGQTEQANQQLLQAQGNLRNALYGARMNLIPGAWEMGSLGRVQDLLAQTRPAAGEEDLRGFEHGYWNRQLHGELRTVKLRRMQGRSAVLSASGTRVAGVVDFTGTGVRRIQVRDTATGNELFSRSIPPGRTWMDIELSGDGSRVAWVEAEAMRPGLSARGRLQVWDLNTSELLLSKEDIYYIGSGNGQVYLNDDGTRVALIPHFVKPPTPGLYAPNPSALTVWEVASGRELLRKIVESPLGFREGNLSPDGTKVAAVVTRNQRPEEPRLRIWDVADGQEQLDLSTEDIGLRGTAFIPQQNCVLLAGYTKDSQQQGLMQVRDAATGKLQVSWPEPELGTGKRYAVSPDGTRVAIVSLMSPLLHVRDLATGRLLVAHKAHEGAIDDAAFSADGSRVLTVASQGELKEWAVPQAVADRDARQEFRFVSGFTISADGKRMALIKSATPGVVTILDVATHGEVARWQLDVNVRNSGALSMALSPDGKALAVISSFRGGSSVSVWDVATQSKRFELGSDELGSGLQYNRDQQPFSPDGNSLALATVGANQSAGVGEFHVKVFDATTGELRHTLSPPEGGVINSCAFSPDGRQIAGVGGVLAGTEYAGQVMIWDLASGRVLHPFQHPNGAFFAVAFNPDGTKLATGTGMGGGQVVDTRGQIVLWDLAIGQQLHVLQGHSSQIYHLVFSPDGRRLASVGPQSSASTTNYSKGEVTLWDVASGQERLSLNVDEGRVFEVTFNHDGSKLLAPVENAPFSSLKIWDATPLPQSVEAHDVVVRKMVGKFPWQKGDIINRLKGDKTLPDELRQAALAVAQSWPEDSDSLNAGSWNVVALQDQSTEAYHRALHAAEQAVKLAPDNGMILNTLGVAQYRVGKYAEAKETLTRTLEMNTQRGPLPSDLAFLAMACQQLGQNEDAASHLQRLRESMKTGFQARNPENQGFLSEVETLLLSPP